MDGIVFLLGVITGAVVSLLTYRSIYNQSNESKPKYSLIATTDKKGDLVLRTIMIDSTHCITIFDTMIVPEDGE